MTIKGFIIDVDGVLVDSPLERAWGDTLRRLMETEWADLRATSAWTPTAYTSEVYQDHVSGRARAEGARDLLGYFGIADPDGSRTERLCELKQKMILELIAAGEFEAYGDALRFLTNAKNAGGLLAAASSSKNANAMLGVVKADPTGPPLLKLFDANVCGQDFKPGKPHPGIFLAAAKVLGLEPAQCVVIEDATSGVKAAKAAGAACIGVARLNNCDDLRQAGADWVVTSLDQVFPARTANGIALRLNDVTIKQYLSGKPCPFRGDTPNPKP